MEANKVLQHELGVFEVVNLTAEKHSAPPCVTPQAGRRGTNNVTKVMRLMAEAEARDSFLVSRRLYTRCAPDLSSEAGRAITRSGMWSGIGFVGASTLAAGWVLLTQGGATAGLALSLILAGGAVATFGWRSAWKVLEGIDRVSPVAPDTAPSPCAARRGDGTAMAWRLAPAHPRTVLGIR